MLQCRANMVPASPGESALPAHVRLCPVGLATSPYELPAPDFVEGSATHVPSDTKVLCSGVGEEFFFSTELFGRWGPTIKR